MMRPENDEENLLLQGDPRDDDSSEPFVVAGGFDVWWLWAIVALAGVLGLLTAVVATLQPAEAIWLAIPTAMAAIVAGALAIYQRQRRCWLGWDATGFRLIDAVREREYLDADVASLAMGRKLQHSFGTLVGEIHELQIWFVDPAILPQLCEIRAPAGEPSPFQPLITRLQARLLDRAEESLRRGNGLRGETWELRDGQIQCANGRHGLTVLLDDISAIDSTSEELRIWRQVDPLPITRLKMRDRDIWLLASLLQQRVGQPGDPEVLHASGLGRVLREYRPKSAAITSLALALFASVVAGVCLAAAVVLFMMPLALLGIAIGITAGALLTAAWRLRRSSFRMHESGISQSGLSGQRSLSFGEIDLFVFDARRQYSKGRYVGTMFTMTFVNQTRPRDSILHTERAAFETEDLTRLRDRVAEEVASRLAKQWAQEGSVVWTPELTLRGESLRFNSRKMLSWKSHAVDIPYSSISDFDVQDGWFLVWDAEDDRAVLKVRTSNPNFYPGLLLFEQIVNMPAVYEGDAN